MQKETVNWISNPNELSYPEKVNRLLEIKDNLVLIQVQELEKFRAKIGSGKKPADQAYIDQLYKHYIVEGKPKLYLC